MYKTETAPAGTAPAETVPESPTDGNLRTRDGLRRKVVIKDLNVVCRNQPSGGKPIGPPLDAFAIRFVYGESPPGNLTMFEIGPREGPTQGWVLAASVLEWDTRLMARPTPRRSACSGQLPRGAMPPRRPGQPCLSTAPRPLPDRRRGGLEGPEGHPARDANPPVERGQGARRLVADDLRGRQPGARPGSTAAPARGANWPGWPPGRVTPGGPRNGARRGTRRGGNRPPRREPRPVRRCWPTSPCPNRSAAMGRPPPGARLSRAGSRSFPLPIGHSCSTPPSAQRPPTRGPVLSGRLSRRCPRHSPVRRWVGSRSGPTPTTR